MRNIRDIQRSVISEKVIEELLDSGVSLSSEYGQQQLQSELVRAKAAPLFVPKYVMGNINPTVYNAQLRDMELDIKTLIEATTDLDKAISASTILTETEHATVQSKLSNMMVATEYLKRGQLVFNDSFTSAEHVDVENSTAIIDTTIGAIRHKTSIAKDSIDIKAQNIIPEPITKYTGASAITPTAYLTNGSDPFTVIYSATEQTFTIKLYLNLSDQTNNDRLLILKCAAGYLNIDTKFYSSTVPSSTAVPLSNYTGLVGMSPTPVAIPNVARSATIYLTRVLPDYAEARQNYFVFSLYPLSIFTTKSNYSSYVVTAPISFTDLTGAAIPLYTAAIVPQTVGSGTIKSYIAACAEYQTTNTLNWQEVPTGTILKISNSYQNTIFPNKNGLINLNTNDIQIAKFEVEPSKIYVTGGYGCLAKAGQRYTNTPSTRTYTNMADLVLSGSAQSVTYKLAIPITDLQLQPGEVIPESGAISALTVHRVNYPTPTRIPYKIAQFSSDNGIKDFLLVTLPSSPYGRRNSRLPGQREGRAGGEDGNTKTNYILSLNVATISTAEGANWSGYIKLKANETLTITAKSGIITVVSLENGSSLTIGANTIKRLTGPLVASVIVEGDTALQNLVEFDDLTKIRALDLQFSGSVHPLPNEYSVVDGAVIVGSPYNLALNRIDTGEAITGSVLQSIADTFYKIEYNVIDTSTTMVRIKFELSPSSLSTDFIFTEYIAAFQPVLSHEYESDAALLEADNSVSSGSDTILAAMSKTTPSGKQRLNTFSWQRGKRIAKTVAIKE